MKQMLVHCHDDTVQMALIEDGKLVEYAAERSRQQSIVGSFYLGKVVNVLPGMQAAFVDIGLKKMRSCMWTMCCIHIWRSSRSPNHPSRSFFMSARK